MSANPTLTSGACADNSRSMTEYWLRAGKYTPKMKGTGDPKPLLVWAPFTLDDVIEKSVIPQKCDANALHYVRA